MTPVLLAPIFLAGVSLLALPWMIHRIRRPEREVVRFSSLMFVPKVQKEVIERRRLQHLLLMLLRMFLFLLLVFAFARPVLRAPAGALPADGPASHVILLDESMSMNVRGVADAARDEAIAVLDSLRPEDEVCLITFARTPRIRVPLRGGEADGRERRDSIRSALRAWTPGQAATAYTPALQAAQEHVTAGGDSDSDPDPTREGERRRVIHLVTDFQSAGLPDDIVRWRLSPLIELRAIDVGRPDAVNMSVAEQAVRAEGDGSIRIQTRIRNASVGPELSSEVALLIDGAERERKTVRLAADHSGLISFTLPPDDRKEFEGEVRIFGDDLEEDNRRRFRWSPPRKREVLALADDRPEERWPPAWILERAVPVDADLPWRLRVITAADFRKPGTAGEIAPDLIIAADLAGLDEDTSAMLRDYVSRGGSLLFCLNGSISAASFNALVGEGAPVRSTGLRYKESRASRWDMLAWIDFSHPVFLPFEGSRYNDFSSLRFNNHHRLEVDAADGEGLRVVARFEPDENGVEDPAVVEYPVGEGRVMIWAFGMDLPSGNLVRSVKFIPLLHETLSALTGADQVRASWTVGEIYGDYPPPVGESARWTVQLPGEEARTLAGDELSELRERRLERSGFLRWKPADAEEWTQSAAVNFDPAESGMARIAVPEFLLRTTSTLVDEDIAGFTAGEKDSGQEGFVVRRRFWQPLLLVMFSLLFVESWYASRLLR